MDYRKMYLILFDACSKAIEVLQKAQQATEEVYISHDDTPLSLLPPDDTKEEE